MSISRDVRVQKLQDFWWGDFMASVHFLVTLNFKMTHKLHFLRFTLDRKMHPQNITTEMYKDFTYVACDRQTFLSVRHVTYEHF